MSGSLGYESGHSPVGYVTPSFPSLSFELTENPYTSPLLFYSWDIFVFTVYWHLIFSTGFHVAVVIIASLSNGKSLRKQKYGRICGLMLLYGALGAFYGFVIGCFIGLILASVYKAGALHMSTWVPFTWALNVMVFTIIFSYEKNALRL